MNGSTCPIIDIVAATIDSIPPNLALTASRVTRTTRSTGSRRNSGWFDDYDVRQAAYWAVFAGAFGHTYGCHPVWQFFSRTVRADQLRPPLLAPGPGPAWGVARCATCAASSSLARCSPGFPIKPCSSSPRAGAEHRRACRGDGYALIYLPQGGSVVVNLESLPASRLRAWWFDPRTGEARDGAFSAGTSNRVHRPLGRSMQRLGAGARRCQPGFHPIRKGGGTECSLRPWQLANRRRDQTQ